MAVTLLIAFGSIAPHAAAQCNWTSGSTSSTQPCAVGIGTTTPRTPLDVLGWPGAPGDLNNAALSAGGDIFAGNTGASTARMRLTSNANQGVIQWNMYYNGAGYRPMDAQKPSFELDMNGYSDRFNIRRYMSLPTGALGVTGPPLLTILGNGNVGIATPDPTSRLHVTGDAYFSGTVRGGNIQAHYQDLAEWVPATEDLEPGTVVVLNEARRNEVMRSSTAYDTAIAGVVSAQPGVILGEAAPDREQIATTGRVRVKVDARPHPIAVGDLLVTSGTPGKAMYSMPIEIAGTALHRPGTILGKALEPLGEGEGEILVLLSLQ